MDLPIFMRLDFLHDCGIKTPGDPKNTGGTFRCISPNAIPEDNKKYFKPYMRFPLCKAQSVYIHISSAEVPAKPFSATY